MNLKEIKEIINLMNENGLEEIEVEREGAKIKIRRSSSGINGAAPAMVPQYQVETTPPPKQEEQPAASSEKPTVNFKEITSPMVGTFYRASAPEAPAFVEVGQIVEEGQVVCIIEAMKLMNEIKSEVRGKIIEVVAENAEPVEFGQTLFHVEPA